MNRENQIAERDGMLKDLKLLLGMDPKDDSQDDKLLWILSSARARLKVLLAWRCRPACGDGAYHYGSGGDPV